MILKKICFLSGILISLGLLSGCAEKQIQTIHNSPISTKTFTAKYSARSYIENGKMSSTLLSMIDLSNFTTAEIKVVSPLNNQTNISYKITTDKSIIESELEKIAKRKFTEDLNTGILNSDGSYSCSYLRNNLLKVLKESIKIPINVIRLDGITCTWGKGCLGRPTYHKSEMLDSNTLMIEHVVPVLYHGINPIDHSLINKEFYGFARVKFNLKPLECTTNNGYSMASYQISPEEIYWQDAWSRFQKLAEIKVELTRLETELANLNFQDKNLEAINNEFLNKVRDRYNFLSRKTIKSEKIYNVSQSVAISRIQRAVKAFKFEDKDSIFTFKGSIDLISKNQYMSRDIIFSVNVFPEANSRTAVIYKLEFPPVDDTLTKNVVFSEEKAHDVFNQYINIMTKILNNEL